MLQKFVLGFITKQLGNRVNPFHSRRVNGLLVGLAASLTYFVTNASAFREKFLEACAALNTPPEWSLAIEGLVPGASALVAVLGFLVAVTGFVHDGLRQKL